MTKKIWATLLTFSYFSWHFLRNVQKTFRYGQLNWYQRLTNSIEPLYSCLSLSINIYKHLGILPTERVWNRFSISQEVSLSPLCSQKSQNYDGHLLSSPWFSFLYSNRNQHLILGFSMEDIQCIRIEWVHTVFIRCNYILHSKFPR